MRSCDFTAIPLQPRCPQAGGTGGGQGLGLGRTGWGEAEAEAGAGGTWSLGAELCAQEGLGWSKEWAHLHNRVETGDKNSCCRLFSGEKRAQHTGLIETWWG